MQAATWRDLVGRNVLVASLPGCGMDSVVVTVTDVTVRPDGRAVLQLDGWNLWLPPARMAAAPAPAGRIVDYGPSDAVVTNDEPTSAIRAREVLRHDGPLSLTDATRLIGAAHWMHVAVIDGLPPAYGGDGRTDMVRDKIGKILSDRIPSMPSAIPSAYTRGRIRRAESGRWAADLGYAGSTRPLGEHDTADEARLAIEAAAGREWQRLADWLTEHVAGEWTLMRAPLAVDMEDRLTTAQFADLIGVAAATVRGYVSRGQAPVPDGWTTSGRPWWHRTTVEAWERPGQGARTDLTHPKEIHDGD
jgi:hypothetical protein